MDPLVAVLTGPGVLWALEVSRLLGKGVGVLKEESSDLVEEQTKLCASGL